MLEALARLKERRADAATTQAVLAELGETQHVMGEPEAKLMKEGKVAYNVQTAVDAKHKLIVHHEVSIEPNDLRSLLPTASAAKEALGTEQAERRGRRWLLKRQARQGVRRHWYHALRAGAAKYG